MTIKIGDRLPDASFATPTPDGPKPVTTAEVFGGKTVALFAVPGAFTPTCDARHLPGFIDNAEAFKAKGVDTIACVAVNDAFVLKAWAKASAGSDAVMFLADGNADFTKKLGLALDASKFGMGERSQRYSMLVVDGVVKQLNVEQGSFELSTAEHLLGQL